MEDKTDSGKLEELLKQTGKKEEKKPRPLNVLVEFENVMLSAYDISTIRRTEKYDKDYPQGVKYGIQLQKKFTPIGHDEKLMEYWWYNTPGIRDKKLKKLKEKLKTVGVLII